MNENYYTMKTAAEHRQCQIRKDAARLTVRKRVRRVRRVRKADDSKH